jgi:hypothetical protein
MGFTNEDYDEHMEYLKIPKKTREERKRENLRHVAEVKEKGEYYEDNRFVVSVPQIYGMGWRNESSTRT